MNDAVQTPPKGLPDELPAGETIQWQGAPEWRSLALRVFHIREVAIYFAALMAWFALSTAWSGGSYGEAALSAASLVPPLLAAMAVLGLLAWLTSRTTTYTITNRRVVVAYGIALPMKVNLPFAVIQSASVRTYGDGTGDLPLALSEPSRLPYYTWWPNARPWRLSKPEPMLRCVPDAARVAEALSAALARFAPAESAARQEAPERPARSASALAAA